MMPTSWAGGDARNGKSSTLEVKTNLRYTLVRHTIAQVPLRLCIVLPFFRTNKPLPFTATTDETEQHPVLTRAHQNEGKVHLRFAISPLKS